MNSVYICVIGKGAWHKLVRRKRIAEMLTLVGILFGFTSLAPVYARVGDWSTYLSNNGHSGFNSAETIINPTTAPTLKLHWAQKAGGVISTQPVVANGIVYWGSWDGYEHATALNNATVWAVNLGVTTDTNCDLTTAGVASTATIATVPIHGQAIPIDFVGGGKADFYALNANTGAVIWHTVLGSSPSHFIWSSPVVYHGSVYVGMASFGDCPLVQGQLIKMNASTGTIQKVFNTVPNGCTGGSVWDSPTIDTSNGTIFFATGNAGSCSTFEPLAVSLIELNASNLSLVHSWQVPPSQLFFDTDFGSTPTLFRAAINGVATPMVGLANKNGIYYAFKRNAINSGPVWQASIAREGSCPECGDGSISSSAWDGTSLFIGGGNTTIQGGSCRGSIDAVNPATGAFLWQICMQSGPVLGAISVVSGVVVLAQGTSMMVINAATGAIYTQYTDTNSGSLFYAAASISGGVVYIGNADGYLYALGP